MGASASVATFITVILSGASASVPAPMSRRADAKPEDPRFGCGASEREANHRSFDSVRVLTHSHFAQDDNLV
ncbi:MAG TPA: hypothetical protein VH640_17670, partial [Bryobacteraceae bacterium]